MAQFDLDFFKAINDSHGHAAGDQVLQNFAGQVAAYVRGSDIWARWGGEEFVLLMVNTSQDDGAQLLESVRARIAATPAVLSSGIHVPYTVSIGAALLEEGESAVTLLERTDAALYEAKHRGRNRVEWARQKPVPGLAPARSKFSPARPDDWAGCTTHSSYLQTRP